MAYYNSTTDNPYNHPVNTDTLTNENVTNKPLINPKTLYQKVKANVYL